MSSGGTRRSESGAEKRQTPCSHDPGKRSTIQPDAAQRLLFLQRSAGNRATVRALHNGLLARTAAVAPSSAISPPSVSPKTVVVAPGESLQAIAKRYGVTVEALSQANADKLKKWQTPKGERAGFNAGETIVIPGAAAAQGPAPSATAPVAERPAAEEGVVDRLEHWAATIWEQFWKDPSTATTPASQATPAPPAPSASPPASTTATAATAKNPADVIAAHNADGTFTHPVTVTSTKRDGDKQLQILRHYCTANKSALDAYAAANDWLKDSLDWDAFATATLDDDSVWLPFFFALYYGGGGPGVASDKRTLPLVASPKQTTWTDMKGKTRTANASPHIAGRAMDVHASDLDVLDYELKHDVPEFSATGAFPINSTQMETTSGQKAVHINFKKIVF